MSAVYDRLKLRSRQTDIVDRLEFLIEDLVTRTVYSTQIMGDLIDAKREIESLRNHLSPFVES
ncbi:MAG: hypothetical protein O3B73_11690 [bacterium]|nr:hypothetical protein [bacterium]